MVGVKFYGIRTHCEYLNWYVSVVMLKKERLGEHKKGW